LASRQAGRRRSGNSRGGDGLRWPVGGEGLAGCAFAATHTNTHTHTHTHTHYILLLLTLDFVLRDA